MFGFRWIFFGLILSFSIQGLAVEKVSLALNWKPEPQFGGFYAAELAGFYKKNGLEVKILPGGAGTPVVQMVAAGKVDFGIASADEVILSRARGSKVVALFAVYQTNPQGIMTHADRGFETIADVFNSEGFLAIQKGLPYALFLTQKYPKAKVKMVPYAGGVSNFLNDSKLSQQCFVTAEPLLVEKVGKEKGIVAKTFLVSDAGYNPYTTVLITRSDLVKDRTKMVKSLVESVRAGWRHYLDHPEKTNPLLLSLNKTMDIETLTESAKRQKPLIETQETIRNGLGSMTEARWKKLAEQLKDLKLIREVPEMSEVYLVH